MAKYFAWSRILHDGKIVAKPGDEVTEKLVGKEDFAALVDAKSIRTIPFPDDIPETWQGSPRSWQQHKRKKALEREPDMEDFLDDDIELEVPALEPPEGTEKVPA